MEIGAAPVEEPSSRSRSNAVAHTILLSPHEIIPGLMRPSFTFSLLRSVLAVGDGSRTRAVCRELPILNPRTIEPPGVFTIWF